MNVYRFLLSRKYCFTYRFEACTGWSDDIWYVQNFGPCYFISTQLFTLISIIFCILEDLVICDIRNSLKNGSHVMRYVHKKGLVIWYLKIPEQASDLTMIKPCNLVESRWNELKLQMAISSLIMVRI